MSTELAFLNFDGLADKEVEEILSYIYPIIENPFLQLPWEDGEKMMTTEYLGSYARGLNLYGSLCKSMTENDEFSNCISSSSSSPSLSSSSSDGRVVRIILNKSDLCKLEEQKQSEAGFDKSVESSKSLERSSVCEPCNSDSVVGTHNIPFTVDSSKSDIYTPHSVSLNEVSSVHHKMPLSNITDPSLTKTISLDSQNVPCPESHHPSVNNGSSFSEIHLLSPKVNDPSLGKDIFVSPNNEKVNVPLQVIEIKSNKGDIADLSQDSVKEDNEHSLWDEEENYCEDVLSSCIRTFADVLRSSDAKSCYTSEKNSSFTQKQIRHSKELSRPLLKNVAFDISDDKSALNAGGYFYELQLNFSPISLQTRGLINRSNWCYVNATLQVILACAPLYRLLINAPIQLNTGRKSSTPVIDSMVRLARRFKETSMSQELFRPGTPFQPIEIYNMLLNLKPQCQKGQQEDAEEFLSFLVNEMHEEMTLLIQNYAEKKNIKLNEDLNGHHVEGDGDEGEWLTIGAKQRGIITRKVAENKTPISDLLGGQTVNLLTIKSATSASVQPFFTLQLDIQAENVYTLEDALMQMIVRQRVHGYTCAKTKQEVEAYCKVLLKKLPPVLILHLKRFVYNKDGGCKKVMKHAKYPMLLEFKRKELFSSDSRKKKPPPYRLFAVMYHEGDEAIKGHYISDIYHYGYERWIRCDDRNISVITEDIVLSHSPPRVPYLLFYQVVNPKCENT